MKNLAENKINASEIEFVWKEKDTASPLSGHADVRVEFVYCHVSRPKEEKANPRRVPSERPGCAP